MKLLLDTCTLLWLTLDADELSDTARELLIAPSSELVVSSASVWELAVKHALGRVHFDRPLDEWVADVREAYGLASLAIDDESALHLLRLPALHRDPLGPHPRRACAGAWPRDPHARPRDPRLPRAHDLVSAAPAETVEVATRLDLRATLGSR